LPERKPGAGVRRDFDDSAKFRMDKMLNNATRGDAQALADAFERHLDREVPFRLRHAIRFARHVLETAPRRVGSPTTQRRRRLLLNSQIDDAAASLKSARCWRGDAGAYLELIGAIGAFLGMDAEHVPELLEQWRHDLDAECSGPRD
jgi:hypothetical protein